MALIAPRLFKFGTSSTKILNRGIKMSQQLRCEKAMEQLKNKNPYYEKYASKLAAMQQSNPDEFLEKVGKIVKPKVAAKKPEEKPRYFNIYQ